jgi:hypothetical protein|eukprot:COSAG06_NODE_807_length_12165_cov_8.320902_4_plen_52_part_00
MIWPFHPFPPAFPPLIYFLQNRQIDLPTLERSVAREEPHADECLVPRERVS